ncbi:hypothetical protein PT179_01345 [Erysipelothrix rhusiopathiae]|uniref:hypothetical protein n=1 Tax=Erysipelothrix rhusiopathiae TaxID=1648 RepID=UPI0023B0169D|nr:hypothetical protein [Erysipelothrix rhusiopathiae]MDE8041728.1 hypothetical protein [Erysipelothrix rhusiopathiae]MDE8049252.1 hypothetical protein [Erysipelothrix rhusiopathiae]MDE8057907.1 hypothetical protein [Erysipelothrix rhusiopathiae]MDE8066681.1 hypothetical protein [Erysipelothrix rhusiopathiae]
MEKLKKWLEPTKNKVIAASVSVLVVAMIVVAVVLLQKPTATIKFKDDAVFEKYTYLDKEMIESQIDKDNSNYTSFEYEFIKDGEIVSFDEIKKEQISTYVEKNELEKPQPSEKDNTEIMALLEAKDKMPLVQDVDIRLTVTLDSGKQSMVDYTIKPTDTVPLVVKIVYNDIEIKDGDKIVVDINEDIMNLLNLSATDIRFGKEIQMKSMASLNEKDEYTEVNFEFQTTDGLELTKPSVYFYTKDLANLSEAEVKEIKSLGVVNVDTVQVKEELPKTGNDESANNNGNTTNQSNETPPVNTGNDSPSNTGGSSNSNNETPPANNGGGSTALCPNGYDPSLPCDAPVSQDVAYSKMLPGYSFAEADAWAEDIADGRIWNGVKIRSYELYEVKRNDYGTYGYVIYFVDANGNTIL